MKIGLLTLPLETGYGSIMQAFALKTALSNMGHEVVLLRRLRDKKKYPIKRILRRFIKKFVLQQWDTIVLIDKKEIDEYPVITQNTQAFIDAHLQPFSPVYLSSRAFRKVNLLGLDAIVVGSDQVWRPGCMDVVEDFFLCGINSGIRKFSYAASFGVDLWEYSGKQTVHCKEAIKHFAKISVRERSGVNLCQEHLGVKPEFVLDPTLLFPKSFYMRYIERHDSTRDGKFCAFLLDRSRDKQEMLSRLASYLGKGYYYAANNTENRSAPVDERIAPSVSSWLDAFNTADAVFTDSFHGCVFSIIFKKDFYVYVNVNRGASRFNSLLGLFGLEHRVVCKGTNFSLIPPIDWDEVETKLDAMQRLSIEYLKTIK